MKPSVRIPAAQLTLPGGYIIKVYYKSDKQCKNEYGEAIWGYWQADHSGGRIILNRDAPEWRKIQTWGHELLHAVNDYEHWLSARVDAMKREAAETERLLAEDEDE